MEHSQLDLNLGAGLDAKARGLDRIEAGHTDFVPILRAEAIRHALRFGSVTADDVRVIAARLGLTPRHKNAWGAIFRGPGWRKIGEARSTLASNHAHVNPVWAWAPPAMQTPPGAQTRRESPARAS